jgi:hypothetical protein
MTEVIAEYFQVMTRKAFFERRIDAGTMKERDYPFLAMNLDRMNTLKAQMSGNDKCPNHKKEIRCPDCHEWTMVCEPCCNGAMSTECTCYE